jgi:hypothetical protein
MPDYVADNYAGEVTNTASRIAASLVDAHLKVAKAIYSFVGTEAAAEKVKLFDLPAGARVVPELSRVRRRVDPATTLTVDIGTLANPDLYCDGLDAGAVGTGEFTSGLQLTAPETLTAKTTVYMTFATLATPSATGEIEILAVYELLPT